MAGIANPPVNTPIMSKSGLSPVWRAWFVNVARDIKNTADEFSTIATGLTQTSEFLEQIANDLSGKVDNGTFENHNHKLIDLAEKNYGSLDGVPTPPVPQTVTIVTGVNFVNETVSTQNITFLKEG